MNIANSPLPDHLAPGGRRLLTPYAIGDIQGCCDSLIRLLEKLPLTESTPIWFAGDLVNRGPNSAETLRQIMALGERATAILGNHDLHLLAIAAGCRKQKTGDTLDSVLAAPDADNLIDWLRQRPLACFDGVRLMVHAGVLPQWNVATTLELASQIESRLRAPDWRTFIADLLAEPPQNWHPALDGMARIRVAVSALTRIRMCRPNGEMDLKYNGAPDMAPADYLPWFDIPERKTKNVTLVFGHWASLGLLLRPNLCALDTGCVWGNQLTAVPLEIDPLKRIPIQVQCLKLKRPGNGPGSRVGAI